RCYSLVLLYLAIVQVSTAVSSMLVFKKVLSTSSFYIDSVDGVCHQWSSPSLCLVVDAIQMAGTSHHAVMIAFCSCYRYYVLAFTRGEPARRTGNFALTPLLEGSELERAMNESDAEFDQQLHLEQMLLMMPQNWSTLLATVWIQALIVPVGLLVLLCSFRINAILASVEHMSEHSKQRHAQILKFSSFIEGLLIQAMLPAIYAITIVAYRV
ncbi:hypothetical protein PMAYCL1PPCAC_16243, partial [Pristionchus mayeri]